ncbi:Long-chain-alcohol oxidase FAO3 [Sphaceloma murrayae]|uniref:Long-chain-alcohol oxidase n=1 Tax=Sphaceloma murrayae TaxID=2082308 RepID=A0A2K1QT54_9PEZI|nr:Long-chain-alcohol oxidase FAO3 [Sphaceloma murrayae]
MQKILPKALLVQDGALSEQQWQTLEALAEAVIPSISLGSSSTPTTHQAVSAVDLEHSKRLVNETSSPGKAEIQLEDAFFAESAASSPAFKDAVQRFIAYSADSDTKAGLVFLLNALATRVGSAALTGRTTPVTQLPLKDRQAILAEWQYAYIPFYRGLYRSFTQLACIYWIRTSPTLGKLLTYPYTPINHSFGPGFPFNFLQMPPSTAKDDMQTITADVVIIGSGCTGAVAASVLAAAGLSVIVADKSYYWPPEYLPMTELGASQNLFHNGGITQVDGGLFSVISGSCWGGGGSVNWSASLQLQSAVRQEWARLSGLPHFTSHSFQADLDAVCERMGVSTSAIEHNATNKILLEGARRLGMAAKTVPQNTGGEAHQCGYCTLGCGSCGKKGPTETWLPDAAKAGARFIEGFTCSHVNFAPATPTCPKRATSVEGTWLSRGSDSIPNTVGTYARRVRLQANKAVILAAGALQTPVLLKRSGLTNPHIGSHLKLHPVNVLGAIMPERTSPWDGPILTSVVSELENLDGRHHGVKLEATTMLPGWFLPLFPWRDALDFKTWCGRMGHAVGYISLARDSGEGKVYEDPKDEGRTRLAYNVNRKDGRHIARGLEALARITWGMGAREVRVSSPGVPALVRGQWSAEEEEEDEEEEETRRLEEWIAQWIEPLVRNGMHSRDAQYASAHQMGSARMGSRARDSAVDGEGRVWGTEGLFVVDTSVFPAASGVNPMITGMAVARGIARGMVKREVGDVGRARL